jgi:hypothetical protein
MPLPFYANYNGTITNAGGDTDLIEINPASNKPVKLRRFVIGQTSEVGDTAEEGLRISIIRLPATFTSGSGGSTVTKTYPRSGTSVAAGATIEANNTTIATTSGTAETLYELAWNVRNVPTEFVFYDDLFMPTVSNGEGLVIRLQSTVADDISAVWMAELIEE